MTTIILNPAQEKDLQPAVGLWKLYSPETAPYRFQAQTRTDAETWQKETRQALNHLIGFQDLPSAPLSPRKIEVVDKGTYMREKWLLRTSSDSVMPVYILVPKKGKKPYPVVMALHGHGYGVKDIVGLRENGEEKTRITGYQKNFAVSLVKRGFLVAAPEISCFGERQTDFSYLDKQLGSPVPTTCMHTAALAFHLGGSVIGLRVHDAKRLVDYLETRDDADLNRLGAMGISGGGMHTFFSTCLDTRIRACVVSGYYSTFKGSILAMNHCFCNFAPGLHQFGEEYDLAGLIAPRPMLVEAADRDPIFPLAEVEEGLAKGKKVFGIFGAAEQLEADYFKGNHQINGKRAYDFLVEKL
jgi:dienelactone hydrolase